MLALAAFTAAGCANAQAASDGAVPASKSAPAAEVVLVSDVAWEPLNPARGDQSPQAGTLWGDRNGGVPTGFLARFVDGFRSPPHIHNATYRAVVISGTIHNDDPDAADMWMPAGSFWTQPQGEVHVTAARGGNNLALVEIDQGPYLVRPPEDAFDSGERPINVDASNIVWVDPPGASGGGHGLKLAYLWGSLQDGQSNGTFVKFPAGCTGTIHSHGATFHAVVVKGLVQHRGTGVDTLAPGSYFGSMGQTEHEVSSEGPEDSILYVRTDGRYELRCDDTG